MPRLIDAYLIEDLVVYRGLQRGGAVGKGFRVNMPDMENTSVSWLERLKETLASMLRQTTEETRYQFRWSVDSDYSRELTAYKKATEELAKEEWEKRVREERYNRYIEKMQAGELRRERLDIWATTRVDPTVVPKNTRGGRKFYSYLMKASTTEMEEIADRLNRMLGGLGASVNPMNNVDHLREFFRFANPTQSKDPNINFKELYNEEQSVWDTCFLSDVSEPQSIDHGFYRDGHYNGILVLKNLPKATFMGMISRLTKLSLMDYCVTVNISNRPLDDEIDKANDKIQKLQKIEGDSKIEAMVKKLQKRVETLMKNQVVPLNCQFVVRAWAESAPDLQAKMSALKSTFSMLGGAQTYEPSLTTSAIKYYNATVPGWSWDSYKDNTLYIEDINLASLLPVTATPVADLGQAEALYDGANGNIIGLATFVGREGNKRPEHGIAFGSSGAGKSVTVVDLLSQISCYYGFIGIIEDGLSYNMYTRVYGEKPIIVESEGDLTFNYFDTLGLPLTAYHKGAAVGMLQVLIGETGDIDKDKKRRALLSDYVNQAYYFAYQDWLKKDSTNLSAATRLAMSIQKIMLTGGEGLKFLDAFTVFRDLSAEDEAMAQETYMEQSEEEVSKFADAPENEEKVMSAAYSLMEPKDMPQHSPFKEAIYLASSQHGAPPDLEIIAHLLEPWCSYGQYGAILDGVNNVDIGGMRIAHFELGRIGDQDRELRAVVAYLITNTLKNEIMRRPRSQRKAVILEELSALLDIPEGERMTRDFYERLRKYNGWVFSIIQTYKRLANHPVRGTVMDNSRIALFLRQTDKNTLAHMTKDRFELPDITKSQIMSFPDPSQMLKKPYAGFVFYHDSESRPNIAVGHNVTSPEMITCAATSGESYEKMQGLLRIYKGDALALIKGESHKFTPEEV